jgi:hypothetical protein
MKLDVYIRGLGSVEANYYLKFKDVDFNDYPCIKGFYITDEPSARRFDDLLLNYVSWKNEEYKDLYWHLNLFPSYAYEALGTTATENNSAFENYLFEYNEKVLKNVQEKKDISFDHYPLLVKEGKCVLGKNWLIDTYSVGEIARKENIDFCVCIQSFTDGNGWRILDDEDYFRFQFNTYLAFGANMFEIFIYQSIYTSEEGYFKGMIENGEKTNYYRFVQNAIKEVRCLEPTYLEYDWKGISILRGTNLNEANNDLFAPLQVKSSQLPNCIESIQSDEDCIIGIFEKRDKYALMIVNFNDPIYKKNCNIKLNVMNDKIKKLHLRNQKIETSESEMVVSIDCGGGVFIEILK